MRTTKIQNEIKILLAYALRLGKKWILYVGLVPYLYDFVSTYFPTAKLPQISPALSLVIFLFFFLLANYSLFKEYSHEEPYKIDVRLADGKVKWDQYGISRYAWSSFLVKLEIDNFASNHPDYVSVSMRADSPGGKWVVDHFIFERVGKPGEEFHIEPGKMEKVKVFISDHAPTRTGTKSMPEIDKKTLELKVKTRSGAEFVIPIGEGNIFPKDKIG